MKVRRGQFMVINGDSGELLAVADTEVEAGRIAREVLLRTEGGTIYVREADVDQELDE